MCRSTRRALGRGRRGEGAISGAIILWSGVDDKDSGKDGKRRRSGMQKKRDA